MLPAGAGTMSATPMHPFFAPGGWVITDVSLNPARHVPDSALFRALIERKSTHTAVHAPGATVEEAIAEAWRLAGIIEGAQ